MQEHGIKFTSCDEETARDFLTNRTYFFKLKAFENNFSKIDDQYVNLDFAYLMDLSIIDCHLRTLLNYCCLNAEHALKVRFNKLIMNDSSEDGYNIVQYFDPNGTYRFTGFGPDSRYGRSLYTEGLLQKYFNDPAVWNLWEVITFRTLCDLYEKYLEKRRFKDNVTNLFQSVRIMRNASSHNNCLLIGVRKNIRITIYTQNCLTELGRVLQTSTKVLYNPMKQYPLIHDFRSFAVCSGLAGVRGGAGRVGWRHGYLAFVHSRAPASDALDGRVRGLPEYGRRPTGAAHHDRFRGGLAVPLPRAGVPAGRVPGA